VPLQPPSHKMREGDNPQRKAYRFRWDVAEMSREVRRYKKGGL